MLALLRNTSVTVSVQQIFGLLDFHDLVGGVSGRLCTERNVLVDFFRYEDGEVLDGRGDTKISKEIFCRHRQDDKPKIKITEHESRHKYQIKTEESYSSRHFHTASHRC